MIIQKYYRVYNTNNYIISSDNGIDMLECPYCHARSYLDRFISSVGTKGLSFCPYCGTDLRSDQLSILDLA